MHAIVCIKSVPSTTDVRINPETNTLMRGEVESIINPFDVYAVEEALRLREVHGGTVTVITMGPPQAEKELRDAVAMGCDRAVLLSAREFAGADTWATAYTLARALEQLAPFDLVLCGKQAIDGDTGQVGPGIARQLGIPQLTYVSRLRHCDPAAGEIIVERQLEEGLEVVRTRLPALVTVVKGINSPRLPSPRNLRRARRMELPVWDGALLQADPDCLGMAGSPTKVVQVFAPPRRTAMVQWCQGACAEDAAAELVAHIKAEKVI